MNNRGFTLLELLVAIAVFAVMATATYEGFNAMLSSKQKIEKEADELSRLQMALVIIQRDLEQIIRRPIRDEYGEVKAFLVNNENNILLEFTRVGVKRLFSENHSDLQRIAYRQDEDKLIRLSWDVLDRAQDTRPVERVLLSGVKAITFNSINAAENTPSPLSSAVATPMTAQDPASIMPDGIELTLEMDELGSIKRLFLTQG
ncbi:MAG: GspJ family T2SS minor pseudopilin variant XcpW [Gammaproteobacteria bacterium]|nr:MAG: GspJ family T2SS minor pseudopilin variant XcpW [Gammaproteobacteria bacterium]